MPARERRFNVPVPLSFKAWIERQVDAGGFGTPAEYIRHLLRHAQAAATVDEIDRRLIASEASGPAKSFSKKDWADLVRRAERRAASLHKNGTGPRRRSA